MISTDAVFQQESREEKVERLKSIGYQTLPEGDGEKAYDVICHNSMDWQYIDSMLCQDGTSELNVPVHHCECIDKNKSLSKVGTYMLTDAEAESLRLNPKVASVVIAKRYYKATFLDEDQIERCTSFDRYISNVKNQRYITSAGAPSNPDSTYLGRSGYNRLRMTAEVNPWRGSSNTTVIDSKIPQKGDGSDVDVIVADDGSWFGHIEFVKTGVGEPQNYRGGNVLSPDGKCGLLDLVLDAPYYLDPDFFNADAANRLMTRWDGTTVPVESYARSWWGTESTSTRSAKFVSTDLGGTATIGSDEDFGTISITSGYTRSYQNGSNTAKGQGITSENDYHSVPCQSQAYGKTHGWAYNANKWYVTVAFNNYAAGTDNSFKMIKVFHQLKPDNPSYGTKDPTIMSNSWSAYTSVSSTGYYYYRTAGDGTGGVSYTSKPGFVNYYTGNPPAYEKPTANSTTVAIGEAIDAGVLVFVSAGNNNAKLVKANHPDYNNYTSPFSSTTLSEAETFGYIRNRAASPAQGEILDTLVGSPTYNQTVNRAFIIGALESDQRNSNLQEEKAYETATGNAVDMYTGGYDSVGAQSNGFTTYLRYDSTYTIDSTTSITSNDCWFGGTSSACPVAVGLVATKLQHNRSWTWRDLKNWLSNSVTNQPSTHFYTGSESTTANDSNWSDQSSLQGGDPKILWDAATTSDPSVFVDSASVSDTTPDEGDSINITITTDTTSGTLYYSIEPDSGSSISASDFTSNSLTGSFNISSGTGSVSLSLSSDSTTEGTENFRLRIREGSTTGNIIATTDYINIADTSTGTGGGVGGFGSDFDAVRFASGDGLVFNGAGMKIYVSPS